MEICHHSNYHSPPFGAVGMGMVGSRKEGVVAGTGIGCTNLVEGWCIAVFTRGALKKGRAFYWTP